MSEIKFFVKLAPFMNKNCKIFGNDTLFGNHRMLEILKYLAMAYFLAIPKCWQW